MGVSQTTKLQLALLSGNCCALCGTSLTLDPDAKNQAIIGEVAHIAGARTGSARYDPNMTDEERHHLDNLIYLCPNDHALIDKQAEKYPVEKLRQIKQEHERKVREAIEKAFAAVAFEELERATQWVKDRDPFSDSQSFTVVPPKDKIDKNKISKESAWYILMGLSAAKPVEQYVKQIAQEDDQFPERLKAGFLEEYHRLRREGLSGDELFLRMCVFAARGLDITAGMAGVAVLVYLFEKCEVFEK